MQHLIDLSKKNVILCWLIKIFCFVGFKMLSTISSAKSLLRTHGIGGQRYKQLLGFKNSATNRRCFIICTGPSLTVSDCEALENEDTFSMNSIINIFDKTSFRPTFYGIQDVKVYASLKDEIRQNFAGNKNVFIADRITKKYICDNSWTQFPLEYTYGAYDRWFEDEYNARFSDDSYKIVYDGFSITMTLIQIAVYMGYKEIYLLGVDCSFSNPNKLHFSEHGVIDTTIDTARERNIAGYVAAKAASQNADFKIYNATRGGELEVFERRNLDVILNKEY